MRYVNYRVFLYSLHISTYVSSLTKLKLKYLLSEHFQAQVHSDNNFFIYRSHIFSLYIYIYLSFYHIPVIGSFLTINCIIRINRIYTCKD